MTQVPEHLYYRSDWDRDLPQDWELGKLLLSQVLPVDSEPAFGALEFLWNPLLPSLAFKGMD